ncbi:glycosyltransferase family 4 protein [Rufibacter sp. LB8]|uniref:glycosyltransferase family 4 protein n=1 Tax=Rufibacter sp. LB8 TaxID=2777781 RepID=UPI00178C6713|nr:glycosyltransferase family 4 protein [Rufibacter sp. LB8]
MKNVLIVNQSAELYGADKILLELLLHYPAGYNPIVVLHEDGPFKDMLQSKGIQVIHASVIKVRRGILNVGFLGGLPFEVLKAFRTIRKELNGQEIHLIHSNATSVFIGAFYSFFFRKKHLWHVHEIIEHPRKIALAYPRIVNFFASKVVFNSRATEKHFTSILPSIKEISTLVYNGQSRAFTQISEEEKLNIRQTYFNADPNDVVIGLVGRISKIKGQLLLLEAFSHLTASHPNAKLVLIGSPAKGKEYDLEAVEAFIQKQQLGQKVVVLDFQANIWPFYDALDIVTFPSTEKESFGLVATEAMLCAKPVVAADHGGLSEIVVHQQTGLLFEPNNAQALAESLTQLIYSEDLRMAYGQNGLIRVKEVFSTEQFVAGIQQVYDELTA